MTEYGSGGTSAVGVSTVFTRFDVVILAGTNSITVTHNLGRLAKFNQPFGTDDNMNVIVIKNEGVNSFDICLQGGILAADNVGISGSYV